jgi:hypothetical protein
LAEVCERRARDAGSRAPFFRAEAHRLRTEAEQFSIDAQRGA